MLAEWMEELPDDFYSRLWYVLPCPKGKRCLLVVQQNGRTHAFNKLGNRICTHQTLLPRNTIVYCIYNEIDEIYYLIDILLWNNQLYCHSEFQCRFFILSSLFNEQKQQLSTIDKNKNPYKFELIQHYFIESKEQCIKYFEQENYYELDGYLFYHSLGIYHEGYSPLTCWLKPFMVEEILEIKLENQQYKKPSDYKTAKLYMHLEQTQRKKRRFFNK